MIRINWVCYQCGASGYSDFEPTDTVVSVREKIKLEHKLMTKEGCGEYRLVAKMMFTKGQFKGV